MAEHRHVSEPGEMVYAARPSWAPIFLAIGIAAMVCGVFASGFIFAPHIYAILGALIVLGAFRSLVGSASAAYFRLPRKQRVRGAALPIETIKLPPKDA
jgi:hypothetical protein